MNYVWARNVELQDQAAAEKAALMAKMEEDRDRGDQQRSQLVKEDFALEVQLLSQR